MKFSHVIQSAFDIQRSLSKGQAFPVLGPVIVSPIKMAVGVSQLVAGVGLSIIFSSLALAALTFQRDEAAKAMGIRAISWLAVGGIGFVSTTYALTNMLTLGLFGMTIENTTSEAQRKKYAF